MLRIQPLILALSLGLASFMQVAAQQYTYTTSTITSCGPDASGGPGGAGGAAPTLLGPGNLIVGMPPCPACDCNTCVHSNIYTTSFGAFCPHGTTAMAYTITEVYSGMSAVPTLADRPHCPPGFTTAVETCTVCGEQPITATMTYPVGGSPYVPEMAVATQTGSPAPPPAAPAGGNNGSIPYTGPTAGANNSQTMATWAGLLAAVLCMAAFGL